MPSKNYACVLADGTTTELPNKRKAILCGEASGQAFTVLSPRGYEVHVQDAPEPKPRMVLATEVKVGMKVVSTSRKRNPIRTVTKVRIGKYVSLFDESTKSGFAFFKLDEMVEVVED